MKSSIAAAQKPEMMFFAWGALKAVCHLEIPKSSITAEHTSHCPTPPSLVQDDLKPMKERGDGVAPKISSG